MFALSHVLAASRIGYITCLVCHGNLVPRMMRQMWPRNFTFFCCWRCSYCHWSCGSTRAGDTGCIQWTKDAKATECMAILCMKSVSSAVIIAGTNLRMTVEIFHQILALISRTPSAMFCFLMQASTCTKSANQMATKNEWLKRRLPCQASDECQNFHSSFVKIIWHVHSLLTFDTFRQACGLTLTCSS